MHDRLHTSQNDPAQLVRRATRPDDGGISLAPFIGTDEVSTVNDWRLRVAASIGKLATMLIGASGRVRWIQ